MEKKIIEVKCSGGCGRTKKITLHEGDKATWICPACASKQPHKQESQKGKLFIDGS